VIKMQQERHTKNSKKTMIPTSAKKWAIEAMKDPNLAQLSNIGPRNREMKNKVTSTAAFQTTGPIATTQILIRGLGFCFPFLSGNDLTNMYAMMKSAAMRMGQMISDIMTALHPARGTSPESFSEG
jgi:hypothetical protein